MPSALKLSAEEGVNDVESEAAADNSCADAKHVGVVVDLVSLAEYVSPQRAARMPLCLFAAMDIPMPVPQMRMP